MRLNNRISQYKGMSTSICFKKIISRLNNLENLELREAYIFCDEIFDEVLSQYPRQTMKVYEDLLKVVRNVHLGLYTKLNQPEEKA